MGTKDGANEIVRKIILIVTFACIYFNGICHVLVVLGLPTVGYPPHLPLDSFFYKSNGKHSGLELGGQGVLNFIIIFM